MKAVCPCCFICLCVQYLDVRGGTVMMPSQFSSTLWGKKMGPEQCPAYCLLLRFRLVPYQSETFCLVLGCFFQQIIPGSNIRPDLKCFSVQQTRCHYGEPESHHTKRAVPYNSGNKNCSVHCVFKMPCVSMYSRQNSKAHFSVLKNQDMRFVLCLLNYL